MASNEQEMPPSDRREYYLERDVSYMYFFIIFSPEDMPILL